MRREVDESIPNHKSFGFWVKIGCFSFTCSWKRNLFKSNHFRYDFSLNKRGYFFAETVMVSVGANNDHRRGGQGAFLRPIDRVEKDNLF